jgi:CDP-diacylglycerol---serine O-phosphatidyltransferase
MGTRPLLRHRFRRPKRRIGRLPGVSLANLIPNMMTVAALCAGLTAIRFGIQDRFHEAVLFVVLAGVFDGLDGRLARMLNSTSKLGAELDSLADLVSFGVAPALILYMWSMQDAGVVGWLPMLLLAVCAALRLARFNVMMVGSDLPAYAYNYFVGVPAPAAAAVALMPLMLSFEIGVRWVSSPWLVGCWAVMVGALMVSTLPTFSFKRLKVPQRWAFFVLIAIAMVATLLLTRTWLALVGIGAVYLATIPVSIWRYNLLRAEAERLQAADGDDDTTEDAVAISEPEAPAS